MIYCLDHSIVIEEQYKSPLLAQLATHQVFHQHVEPYLSWLGGYLVVSLYLLAIVLSGEMTVTLVDYNALTGLCCDVEMLGSMPTVKSQMKVVLMSLRAHWIGRADTNEHPLSDAGVDWVRVGMHSCIGDWTTIFELGGTYMAFAYLLLVETFPWGWPDD
ncbi:conserved hypothetical protein [Ricinus communis]|uniref:Uncharacterized protein n=1 Tax=Ricinus communis TaxID=3988 RepID=B9RHF2_RICCO|nr:conserved hypothetical protein [Ricinus communis]